MKTRIIIRSIIAAFIAVALYSCEGGFWNCLDGNGIPAEETRELSDFTGFVSEGAFDILVIPDSVYEIEIEADENLMRFIRTRVSGGKLVIDTGTRNCLRSRSPMLLTIRVPMLNYISLTGSGLITADDFSAERMRVEITGSGSIDMRGLDVGTLDALITGSGEMVFWGTASETDFDITGSGNIDAFELISGTCSASISGSGSMYVYVESRLNAYISGTGNIYYKGNPIVKANISGSGSVIPSNK